MKTCYVCEQPSECSKNICKICRKAYDADRYKANKAIWKAKNAKYYIENKQEISEQQKQYYTENKKKILSRECNRRLKNPNNKKEKDKAYRLKNKNNLNAYFKARRAKDLEFKLSSNLRSRLTSAIRNHQKVGSAVDDLGCSIEFLRSYLESSFQPGMNWKNWGLGPNKWQIDHIRPLQSFNLSNRAEFLLASSYLNLQPLWSYEHSIKTAKERSKVL